MEVGQHLVRLDQHPCDDILTMSAGRAVFRTYVAVAGEAEPVPTEDGFGLRVAGIELSAPDAPAVTLADGELPAFEAHVTFVP